MAGIEKKAKRGMGAEMQRTIDNSSAIVDNIRSGYKSSSQTIKDRKKKGYAVSEDMSREDFEKSFKNFRLQITVYFIVFFISVLMAIFSNSLIIPSLVAMYAFAFYLIYIRDIHRGRIILKRWDLRDTPLTLTWKTFFRAVRKNPKILLPLT